MPDNQATPVILKPFLMWLERIFPLKPPNPDDSDREVWMKAGEQRVLTKLRHEYNEQNKRGDIEA